MLCIRGRVGAVRVEALAARHDGVISLLVRRVLNQHGGALLTQLLAGLPLLLRRLIKHGRRQRRGAAPITGGRRREGRRVAPGGGGRAAVAAAPRRALAPALHARPQLVPEAAHVPAGGARGAGAARAARAGRIAAAGVAAGTAGRGHHQKLQRLIPTRGGVWARGSSRTVAADAQVEEPLHLVAKAQAGREQRTAVATAVAGGRGAPAALCGACSVLVACWGVCVSVVIVMVVVVSCSRCCEGCGLQGPFVRAAWPGTALKQRLASTHRRRVRSEIALPTCISRAPQLATSQVERNLAMVGRVASLFGRVVVVAWGFNTPEAQDRCQAHDQLRN